ncbi:MAG TPA: zinc-binding dehydrogenase [Oligoflexus sp.]|uniref:zinc-binding dehydrogenase n=1 Tax=Oligoflexus sp. TaxID=1971216 RepID=UPI002D5578E3|nr:zinc-binding dehydrogenase [Oligoflexus sp.]HYX39131.1 zinc-binding dehydrogenase [Oligoflexus sp.]
MARAARIKSFGGPEAIVIEEIDPPSPGTGEVRINVEASSLVFTDLLIRRNLYPVLKPVPTFTLGYSLVGHIESLGPAVNGWKSGDRVADLTQIGSNADLVVRPADKLVRVPDSLDAAEAEVMILSGVSAYQALTHFKSLKPGARVLITGASGAVGLLAVQLCRHMRLECYGVASKANLGLIKEAGAFAIAYDEPKSYESLLIASGKGFDLILELAASEPLRRMRRLLKSDGILIFAGLRSAWNAENRHKAPSFFGKLKVFSTFARAALASKSNRRGVRLYDISTLRNKDPELFRRDLEHLFALLAKGEIVPLISGRFLLEDIAKGHQLIEEGRVKGRLVTIHGRNIE